MVLTIVVSIFILFCIVAWRSKPKTFSQVIISTKGLVYYWPMQGLVNPDYSYRHIAVWDRALTAREIARIAKAAGVTPPNF